MPAKHYDVHQPSAMDDSMSYQLNPRRGGLSPFGIKGNV